MAISSDVVKQLRDQTGVSVMECKKALEEAGGDIDKALAILGTRAAASVGKKADRALAAGVVASYIHNTGQVGAILVLSSETDFVSKNEEFGALARDIAMHAAAMRPETVEELMAQSYIKDPSKTIADLISAATQKFGERTEVQSLTIAAVK
ncbi:MAG TPA: elongation factor Ts [Candidatus Paceibacterota bacterium]|nr:elongation factor Ts [Candidatus Paceibacterota bacterium]